VQIVLREPGVFNGLPEGTPGKENMRGETAESGPGNPVLLRVDPVFRVGGIDLEIFDGASDFDRGGINLKFDRVFDAVS
jgi:hypothetical protein